MLRADVGRIVVRAGANVQEGCVLHGGEDPVTEIGAGATIGHLCVVHGGVIGPEALIGNGSTIQDGARNGTSCLVGAGPPSRRTRVPDGQLVLDTVGRGTGPLTASAQWWVDGNPELYRELARRHRAGIVLGVPHASPLTAVQAGRGEPQLQARRGERRRMVRHILARSLAWYTHHQYGCVMQQTPLLATAPSERTAPAASGRSTARGDDPTVDALGAAVLGLLRAYRCLNRRGSESFGSGLAALETAVLIGEGEHRLSELAELRGVDQSVISRQIGDLQAQGLVERRPDPSDRRAGLIRLSPDGLQLLARARTLRRSWLRDALARTPTADIWTTVELITALTTELEAHAAHLAPARP